MTATPTIDLDILDQIATTAKLLKQRGDLFDGPLLSSAHEIAAAIDGPHSPAAKIPFDTCIAITTSWLVATGQETHAGKVLDLIRSGNMNAIAPFLHPRGNAVRLALRAWMPLTTTWPAGHVPSYSELYTYYDANIAGDSSWCRWGVLAPIKLHILANGFGEGTEKDKKLANKFIPPVGRLVRAGLKHLFGMEISVPETTAGHVAAYRTQIHLARLAGSSVPVINSGLWHLGEEVLGGDSDDE